MQLDFDYAAARRAGYSDDDILNGLQKYGELDFDLDAARKAGYSSSDILSKIAPPTSTAPAQPQSNDGDTMRGIKVALGQTGPLAKGVVGLVGATAEKAFGEGGISTAVKNWGLHGYQEGMQKLAPIQKENDELTTAWGKAKTGDLGALVDWAQYGFGYALGQGGEALATSLLGGLAGGALAPEVAPLSAAGGAVTGLVAKGAVKEAIGNLIEKAVVKEAASIAEKSAGKISAEEATKQATKNVASRIGQTAALGTYATGQELGTIYGSAEEQASKEGRTLDGADLARIWGTGIAAGGVEGLSDRLGLDALTGRIRVPGASGRAARAVTGAAIGAAGEAGTEGLQTGLERLGAGQSLTDEEAIKDYINSAGLGAVGGASAGGAGGFMHAREPQPVTPAQQVSPLLLQNNPEPLISFPDGSVGRQSDVDAFLNGLPEGERNAARARLYGYEPQPVTPADVLQAQSTDEAIRIALRATEEATPTQQAIKNAQIDEAWKAYAADISAQRAAEFQAAEQARRDADIPAMQSEQQDQAEAQANALTDAQGFGEVQPTAIEIAMQEAQAKRQGMIEAATQRRIESEQKAAYEQWQAEVSQERALANSISAEVGTPAAEPSAMELAFQKGLQRKQQSAPDMMAQAKQVLDAAGVSGNERMEALRNIRSGQNTIEDLLDAHPPKTQEATNENINANAAVRGISNGRTGSTQGAMPVQQVSEAGREAMAQPSEVRAVNSATTGEPNGTSISGTNETVQQSASLKKTAPEFAKVEHQQSRLESEIALAKENAAQRASIKEQQNGSITFNEQQSTPAERGNGNQGGQGTETGSSDSLQRTARSEEKSEAKGKIVERYLGQYGKGMSGLNARAEVAKRNAKKDGITWRAEANEDLGYDRYEVVGYRNDKPMKSESPAKGGMRAEDVTRSLTMLRAKWLGSGKVNTVQSVSDLPEDVRARANADDKTEGLYDPKTGQVYLVADNIKDAARGAWVAAHERIGHGGLRALKDKTVNEAVNYASANRFIGDLAKAIGKERGTNKESLTVEEAISEMSAAVETGDFDSLAQRYGVEVPASARNGIRGVIARVYEAIKRFLADAIGKPVSSVSDADVRALIRQQKEAVETEQAPAPKQEKPQEKTTPEPVMQSRAPAGQEKIPKWAEGLTPEVQDALRKSGAIFTEKTMRQKIEEMREGALSKLRFGILDQFAPIQEKVGRIPYVLARMAKNADGTLEALMLYGRPLLDADGGIQVDTTKKGFVETMQALDGEHDRFFSWLAGRRAEQLKKEGRENLFTNDDISALATLNQGTMKDGSSREAAYLRAQKDVAELNNSVLDVAEKSGLIDKESRKIWQSDFYVPFYRVMEEGVTGPSIKSGLVNQKSIKQLKGGTNNLNDLTQNMLMNWSTLLTASAKNRAARATLQEATKLGIATEADEATIRQMGKAANTKAVSYMDEGKNRWHVVEDDQLLAAISALEFNGYNNQAMKVMSAFKRYLTIAVTATPWFKANNLIRDSVSSIATAGLDANILKNWKSGRDALIDKQTKADLVAGGGVFRFGTMMEGNRGARIKDIIGEAVDDNTILDTAAKMRKFTKRLWDGYQEIGDLSENLNRAAKYKQSREEGKSHLEASFEARDMMDFGLSGAWAGVRALNQILPFFNARLQGLYKLGRAYNDDPRRVGAVIGAAAMASIALAMAYKDDDDWKKRTDADRNNFWWFKVGDTAFRLPKPFELGAMASAIEHATALYFDDQNTDIDRFGTQLKEIVNSQLSMNPIPQVFRPLIDVYANKDAFTGRPIENMAMQRLRPEDRYTYNTSELARLMSKSGVFVDPIGLVSGSGAKQLSPVQIDSIIRGYFSGLGTLATSAVDGLLHHTVIDRGEALPATLKTFAGSFAETLPTNTSRYVDVLYTAAQDIEQSYASYRSALQQGDIEKARAVMEDHKEQIAKYHLVESLKKNESRITQQIQRVMNSKELTGQQKQDAIKRLRKVQDDIARQFAKRQ